MPRKKRQANRKNKNKKKTEESLSWVVTGIVSILVAILALLRFGWLGKELANLLRLLIGDSYLLGGAFLAILGLVMLIYGQPPRFGFKRTSGLILAYLGLLYILASRFFNVRSVHSEFLTAFKNVIFEELARANVTVSVGGGWIGSFLYGILYQLLGQIGGLCLAVLNIISGILMFFDVKFRSLVAAFQKISRSFIQQSKDGAGQLKEKYSEYREQQRKDPNNREKLTDPWRDSEEAKPSLPEIQVAEQHPDPPVTNSLELDDLLKPRSQAEDDQKMILADQQVDHGLDKSTVSYDDNYQFPPLSLLKAVHASDQSSDKDKTRQNTAILEETFKSFGVEVNVKRAILGPTITRYEVQPAVGVKVSRIVNLADDLALALAAKDIRIEAPIPGKPYIGIEVPNQKAQSVAFKDAMEHQDQKAKDHPLMVPLGKDVTGQIISADLTKMPHLLVAGSTGSGKSVAINTILTSILMKARPDEVKLVLIDPKMVELSVYSGVPHLMIPVVTDSRLASKALKKVVDEMERRYKLFAAGSVRNMGEYNRKVAENNKDTSRPVMEPLPYILVVVDELSDLMMVGGHDVENSIVRLGQMARAAGIHMILATQRPSVDVITGLIKANVPSRISFAVSSGVDSRTILDQVGAEKLLGRGDMLYLPIGASKPDRIQGGYIDVDEVEAVVDWVKGQQSAEYDEKMIPQAGDDDESSDDDVDDEYYQQAVDLVRRQQSASTSMLQRRFRIGYNRAARLIDELEEHGVVGPPEGSKPRKVLLPPEGQEE
ncbi:DNA translocase FtsK [Lactobacillus delbrueckii subsp. bulgaricus ATCC 11842 = JCM 1002]|uniref:Cell division protein FtsK n=1 Tax=Lactobacillus delbrueckii subsp. bulgaricus (strain ATCC 11842 / DSM 20081 / BCRC 10696 / JCM 1002 / NBRC 13953 / NCIMB 11778 / NCTC 12712 / WDCM 00102 / Lb 14) TaxID=390333 RepID=Q1GB57_LACDA|nr:DNA translocase FtsK [Lactobacillus delbrueckii]KRN39138.1 DNA translocase FtsK [Lactobacillus delbrueckii subsp. bulgaricus ATCC 11842 = JCM 1002]MDG9748214.1 DNA translocase FtsK [Lactobacillus delbrueckii subsp. bulgaricus ATCC 11842 = JCM 1002]CAI97423.1 Cell division protein FtsK [Lactobacillus delbrueckii subsp. bulgaricus ATCC 11842 = JCM 1002]